MGMLDYLWKQQGEDTRETGTGKNKADEDSSSNSKGGLRPTKSRHSIFSLGQMGLANIGNHLLKSGTITDEYLDLDEDDRLINICTKVNEARKKLSHLPKNPIEDPQKPSLNELACTRLCFNLPNQGVSNISQFATLGQWIDSLDKTTK